MGETFYHNQMHKKVKNGNKEEDSDEDLMRATKT